MNNTKLMSAIPVLPQTNVIKAAEFYRSKMGFKRLFAYDDDYAAVGRDGIVLHFYKCDDKHVAENTSCRVIVENVDRLFAEFEPAGIIHPNGTLESKPWGMREFAILDEAGVCITFGEEL